MAEQFVNVRFSSAQLERLDALCAEERACHGRRRFATAVMVRRCRRRSARASPVRERAANAVERQGPQRGMCRRSRLLLDRHARDGEAAASEFDELDAAAAAGFSVDGLARAAARRRVNGGGGEG